MKKNNNKGFTLVELIIVIAILAVLTVALAPQFVKYVDKSRYAKDANAAASIETAVVAAIIDVTSDDVAANDPTGDVTVSFTASGVSISGDATAGVVTANVTDVLGGDLSKVQITNKQQYNPDAATCTIVVDKSGKTKSVTWAAAAVPST